jgi:predicted metal-binding membrane protein
MADHRLASAAAVPRRPTASSRSVMMTRGRTTATVVALTATLGIAAAAWIVAVWRMTGMDMGVATQLGSFPFFIGVWISMMTAMMLPGAVPAVARRVHASGRVPTVPLFLGSYLAVWAVVGLAVYAVYRPHGPVAAGVIVIAAGAYEVTPFKRHFRGRCRDSIDSGSRYGLCCVASSLGLMLMFVALGVMSVTWMLLIAIVGLAQKLLPAKAAIDLPVAVAIVAFGIWITVSPASAPGLMPSM